MSKKKKVHELPYANSVKDMKNYIFYLISTHETNKI